MKGGDLLNIKEKRLQYGISQTRLATEIGMDRSYLNQIENGKKQPSKEMIEKLLLTLERLNPNSSLELMIDYCRIRFQTMDLAHVVENILRLKLEYMVHEDYAFYGYTEQFVFGDIVVMISLLEENGILLELKGKGCRQFESFLLAQGRSWYDFLELAYNEQAKFKRLDLAINDKTGVLNVVELIEKCNKEECVSVFRNFKSYRSGELVNSREKEKSNMGNTLYIGSMKSEVYFCVYEKDYEQFVKNGIPLENAEIKNRFEIRLKNERCHLAVLDLLTYRNAERTAFSIINRYIRFVDSEKNKRREDWKMNERWAYFIGDNRREIKLTTDPQPFTLERTWAWLHRQVAPTLKMLRNIDVVKDTTDIQDMIEQAKLSDKHIKLMGQQILSVEDLTK